MFTQDKQKGYFCECCGKFVKEYRRKLNANMALALVVLFKNKSFGYVHIEKYMIEKGYPRSGDFSYLVHWGLIERLKANRTDGSSRNGYYKITGQGIAFADNKITVREAILIEDNKFNGFSGNEVNIKHCLGIKFNYEKLMANE
jgi:hypothetical protein